MSEPAEYEIVLNLQAALLAISVAGGFHYDVKASAVKLDPNNAVNALVAPDGPRPFVLIEVKGDSWTFSPASRMALVLPVTIHWVSDTIPGDDADKLRTYFRGCADVERAIASDKGRGGFAYETRITKRTPEQFDGRSQVWAAIDVDIKTHRVYGQPDA